MLIKSALTSLSLARSTIWPMLINNMENNKPSAQHTHT
jgi:hypothetical protein